MFLDQDTMLGIRNPEKPVGSHVRSRGETHSRQREHLAQRPWWKEAWKQGGAQGAGGRGVERGPEMNRVDPEPGRGDISILRATGRVTEEWGRGHICILQRTTQWLQ